MAWTAPKTFTNEPLIDTDMNTYISDNLSALKDPPSNNYELNESANFTTTSASFTNVDGTDTDGILRLSITTAGGDVMVGFHGYLLSSLAGQRVFLNVSVDGTDNVADDGIIRTIDGGGPLSFVRLITGLSAAAHIFRLRWKVSGGATATLYAGAGTANFDIHPQFWVREVS